MKRYYAFYGDFYDPNGGMNDFVGDFNTINECETAIENKHKENKPDDQNFECAWKQIWDSQKRKFIINTYN